MKEQLKTLLKNVVPERSKLYFWLYINFYWKPREPIQAILNYYSKKLPEVTFIQVGSNDGFTGDPLYKFIRRDEWKGVLIEPVDYLFAALQDNYRQLGNNKLHFENVAISDQPGQKEFYYVANYTPDSGMPVWVNQHGSFNRAHLEQLKKDYPEVEIGAKTIICETVNNIVEKYNFSHLDLLHIDTEGFDYEIIKTIDFSRIRPQMVYYEHRHLNKADTLACQQLLEKAGYSLVVLEYDTLAVQPENITLQSMLPEDFISGQQIDQLNTKVA